MSQMGVDVNLPQASNATSQSQPEGVIVTLLPGGAIKINSRECSSRAISTLLKRAFQSRSSKTKSRLVILEGDRQAFLGSAIQIMDHARKAGADKFAIATSPDSGK